MIDFKQFIDRVYSLLEPLFTHPKKHLKTWLVILGVLVASWAVVFFLRKPKVAEAGWWDETWLYRKAVQISNNNGQDLTDFQVAITLDTASLITAGKMQSDCDDLRITDINGNILPHWIEENNPGCNNAATKIWTKIPTVYKGANATTVYAYYGNTQAGNAENGDNVFEFFDDFNGGINASLWNTGSDYEVVDGELKLWGSNNTALYSKESFSGDIKVFSRVMKESDGDFDSGFWLSYNGGNAGALAVLDDINNGNHNGISMGTWATMVTTFSNNPTDSSWHSLSAWRYGGNMYANFSDETINTTNNYTTNPIGIFSDSDSSSRKMRVDYIALCKFVSSEPSVGSPGSEEQSPGPVAYWKFDEGTGTTAHDSSGQGNDGTLVNGPTWQTEENCISGKCHGFNTSEYVDLGNPKSLQITGSQTISMWLKPANFSARRNPYAKAYGGEGTITQETNGTLNYYYGTAGGNSSPYQGFNSGQSLTLNEWNHIAIVRDLENMKLRWYINGKETNETNASYAAATASSLTAYIGNGYTSRYAGLIDEVKIYPYARTEEQIKSDYVAGASSKGSGAVFGHKPETAQITPLSSKLVAHWKFDEGYGGTAHDSSGNNNHGTLGAGDSAPSWTNEGKVGKALSFDGSGTVDGTVQGDNVEVPESITRTDNYPDGVTYSVWLKVDTDAVDRMSLFRGASTIRHIEIYSDTKKFRTEAAKQNNYSFGTGNFPDDVKGTWSHFAIVFANSEPGRPVRWYQNGKLFHTGDLSSGNYPDTEYFSFSSIGRSTGSVSYTYAKSFDGLIDEVKIYNAALTQEEILQDYNQGMAAVMGQSSGNTGSTAPAGSAAQEYCVPGSSDYCAPPVAEWDFEEGSGNIAYDKSGNGNNGTWYGTGDHWGTGKIGKAGVFNGSDDYVDSGSDPSLNIINNITIGAWIKPNSFGESSWGRIVSKRGNGSGNTGYEFHIANSGEQINALAFIANNTAYYSNNNVLSLNEWQFVSVTRSNSTVTFYVNGQNAGSVSVPTINSDSGNLFIGKRGDNNRWFDGLIDQARIYNYARTPAQIAWDYNRGAPVGHWKFDECQGTVAHDSSGNENHGTINIGASAPQTTAGTCTDASSASAWYNGRSGKWNSSLSFDGVDDYVDCGNDSSLDITNAITIGAWVKPNAVVSGNKGIVIVDARQGFWQIEETKVRGWIRKGDNSGYVTVTSGSGVLSVGEWVHITQTFDGTSLKLWVNGNNVGTTSYTGTMFPIESRVWTIGSFLPGDPRCFDGLIDDVRIYNYALTAEQIKTLYNNGAVRFGE